MNMRRFFRSVYHDNRLRRQNRRSLTRDVGLYARNRALTPLDSLLARRYRRDDLPIGFIVAAPRSGTSLLFQLAARYLELAYPTNFVARYWIAPLVGERRYLERHRSTVRQVPLESSYGATEGIHAPHEFSWFWQFYTDFGDIDELTDEQLDRIDWERIRSKIYGLAGMTGLPWLFKSLNYTVYNITRFARELPESRFIHIRRDPRFVVQSILKCRRERYGDENLWWSLRPADYRSWLERDGLSQVCHQVTSIVSSIERAFESLPDHRKLRIDYEELVSDPGPSLERLAETLGARLVGLDELNRSELRSGNVAHGIDGRLADIEQRLASLS